MVITVSGHHGREREHTPYSVGKRNSYCLCEEEWKKSLGYILEASSSLHKHTQKNWDLTKGENKWRLVLHHCIVKPNQ